MPMRQRRQFGCSHPRFFSEDGGRPFRRHGRSPLSATGDSRQRAPRPRWVAVASLIALASGAAAADGFPDPALAACIAEATQTGNLAGAQELTALTCNAMNIGDATGIGALTRLRELSLFGNRLRTIDLGGLQGLESLNLANNSLTEIDVSGKPALKTLYLFGNRLGKLDLRETPGLVKLRAEKNQLLEVLFGRMPALEKVYLFDNRMEDIRIDTLTGLRFIDVRSNPMPDEVYDYLDEFSGVKASHDGNTEDWQ